MSNPRFLRRALSLAVAGATLIVAGAPAQAQTSESADVESIIVTGTRAAGRTSFDTLAPIDVLAGGQIDSTVSSELVDSLAQLIPSFTVQRLAMSDGQAFVRPAQLRSLSPDQTLILVNGKRRHRSAHLTGRGITVQTLAIPDPATHEAILDAYEMALRANPRIRLVLLTHISHRTGLLLPVRELSALAKRHGADVIVDSAHAIGQIDFTVPQLDADFVGLNLHKWVGAPLGLGLMYVRRERFADIDRHPIHGGGIGSENTLRDRVGVGTSNLAAILTIPQALQLHLAIGADRKQARLRWLRDRWAETLRVDARFDILTPADPTLYAGITSFRIRGKTDNASNQALARHLLDEHGIFTVQRDGVSSGACVRVTPVPFTAADEIDVLVHALQNFA